MADLQPHSSSSSCRFEHDLIVSELLLHQPLHSPDIRSAALRPKRFLRMTANRFPE
jgi:hypothetical protein